MVMMYWCVLNLLLFVLLSIVMCMDCMLFDWCLYLIWFVARTKAMVRAFWFTRSIFATMFLWIVDMLFGVVWKMMGVWFFCVSNIFIMIKCKVKFCSFLLLFLKINASFLSSLKLVNSYSVKNDFFMIVVMSWLLYFCFLYIIFLFI